eukprot:XP_011683808.1 PREDICTED: macrophage mannose receptor 1-like [Strongylocentrotus purpuratus]
MLLRYIIQIHVSNWAPGEPNEKDELHEDCVEMYSNGLWNDEQCLGMANPICERALGATGPPPTTLNYEPPCPEGWYKYDEQCILVVTNRDVFNSARDYCRYLNSDLVVVKTQGLNDFIANLISGFDDDGFWLGLTDKKEMYEFVWVDGTALGPNDYDNWMPNEPNESDGLHEDCVEMLANTGKWNDEQCVAPQKYICARPTGTSNLTSGAPVSVQLHLDTLTTMTPDRQETSATPRHTDYTDTRPQETSATPRHTDYTDTRPQETSATPRHTDYSDTRPTRDFSYMYT